MLSNSKRSNVCINGVSEGERVWDWKNIQEIIPENVSK